MLWRKELGVKSQLVPRSRENILASLGPPLIRLQIAHLSYSLNSLKGGYIGDYVGDYYRGY